MHRIESLAVASNLKSIPVGGATNVEIPAIKVYSSTNVITPVQMLMPGFSCYCPSGVGSAHNEEMPRGASFGIFGDSWRFVPQICCYSAAI